MKNNETITIDNNESVNLKVNEREKLEISKSILGESKISCIINGNLL